MDLADKSFIERDESGLDDLDKSTLSLNDSFDDNPLESENSTESPTKEATSVQNMCDRLLQFCDKINENEDNDEYPRLNFDSSPNTTPKEKSSSKRSKSKPMASKRRSSIDEQYPDRCKSGSSNLPDGWKRETVMRRNGASAGKFDVYIKSKEGKKFRSRNELLKHCQENYITDIDVDAVFSKQNL